MSQPRLSQLRLWERHEARVLNILRVALEVLSTRSPSGSERELNREFYFCILEVNGANRGVCDDWFPYPPTYEALNPPSPGTAGSVSERKIPDFYWGYLDHQEPDARRSARHFVFECKRLGPATAASRVFNVRYVTDGVKRFLDPDWMYGKDVASGAMVGYVESMTPDDVVKEVNATATKHGIPELDSVASTPPLHELDHHLARPFKINPFRLIHLWIETSSPPPS